MAFVTTEGFRDVIEMRSENRFEQYDLNLALPVPLVPRKDRFTVARADGGRRARCCCRSTPAEVARAMAERIVAGGYEAVAIGLMHAYANDAHERHDGRGAAPRPRRACRCRISSVISPQMRELPRFNTVIANAYVQPQVAAYLGRLVARLARGRDRGAGVPDAFGRRPDVGRDGGGTARAPAGIRARGRRDLCRRLCPGAWASTRCCRFDMGGTTAKICLIEDGTPEDRQHLRGRAHLPVQEGLGHDRSRPRWSRWSRSGRAAARSPRSTRWGASRSGRDPPGPNRGPPATSAAARSPR